MSKQLAVVLVITPESDEIVASDLFKHCVCIGTDFPQICSWLGYHEEELFFGLKNLVATAVLSALSFADGESVGNDLADAILKKLTHEVQAVNVRKVERRQPTAWEICSKLFVEDPHEIKPQHSAETEECSFFSNQEVAAFMSRGYVVMDGFLDAETVLTIHDEASASVGARILAARAESAGDAPAAAGDPSSLALPPQASGQGSASSLLTPSFHK
jgi:hypothetical protein